MRDFRSFCKHVGIVSLTALPLCFAGCRSSTGGWGMPSFAWNPWKSSSSDLASAKPSNQVPTPPQQMLAGAGSARPSTAPYAPQPASAGQNMPGGYNTSPGGYAAAAPRPGSTYAPPAGGGYAPPTIDYGTRQASATQPEGQYYTGPYNTGGQAAAAQPYGANGAQVNPYAGQGAQATADRRSDVGYGATSHSGAPTTYGGSSSMSPATPGYGTYSPPGGAAGMPAGGTTAPRSYNAPAYNAGSQMSPYSGATGQSGGASGMSSGRNTWNSSSSATPNPSASNGMNAAPASSPVTAMNEGGYRPGSTSRSTPAPWTDVKPASYTNNASATGATSGGDYDSSYPTTGAASPTAEGNMYR